MVTYSLQDGGAALEHDFPQFRYRLQNLEDRMISYFIRGKINCIVAYSYERTKSTRFTEVTFNETAAKKYETFMQKYFRRAKNSLNSTLPRPDFSVEIEVEYVGGFRAKFEFSFAGYCDAHVLAFCKEVDERGQYLYRHRFSKPKQE